MKPLLTCLFTLLLFSQQEASNWYFGRNAGLKFHENGTVTALSDGQLNTWEGCATISDAEGNLLFYTDGWSDGSSKIKRNNTGEVEIIIYLGGDAYSANTVIKSDGISEQLLYLHRDYIE